MTAKDYNTSFSMARFATRHGNSCLAIMRQAFMALLLGFALALPCVIHAQQTDTILAPNGRLAGYHYSWWYDNCYIYFANRQQPYGGDYATGRSVLNMDAVRMAGSEANTMLLTAKSEYVEHPSAIAGLAVLQLMPQERASSRHKASLVHGHRAAEYIHILQYDAEHDSITLLGSARWDTAAPTIVKIPTHATAKEYVYAHLYQVNIPQPVMVDSVFYLAGTFNSNSSSQYTPTAYAYLYSQLPSMRPCHNGQDVMIVDMADTTALRFNTAPEYYGLYMPRIEYAQVDAQPFRDGTGQVYPSGKLSKHVTHTFYAKPEDGYHFVHWDDGNTDNPRRINLKNDTSLIAYFERLTTYQVTVVSNNPELGRTLGSGQYHQGETAMISAMPSQQGKFLQWSDGNTENPRMLNVTQTENLTANFVQIDDIVEPTGNHPAFILHPDQVEKRVTISFPKPSSPGKLMINNYQGKSVMVRAFTHEPTEITIHLLPGSYYITYETEQESTTQKLVIAE